MKHLKSYLKIFVFLFASIMILESPLAGFASSPVKIDKSDYNSIRTVYNLESSQSIEEFVNSEVNVLRSSYSFGTEELVSVTFDGSHIVYKFYNSTFEEDIFVKTYINDNGNRVVEIDEGNAHDVLTTLDTGETLLNGHSVKCSVISTDGIMPLSEMVYHYSTTPIIGNESQYSTFVSRRNKISVEFGDLIVKLSQKTISYFLKKRASIPSGTPLDNLFDKVAGQISVAAVSNAPEIKNVYYDEVKYVDSAHTLAGLHEYHKYELYYFRWKEGVGYKPIDSDENDGNHIPAKYFTSWVMT